jgi:hypothetical protein
MGLMEEIREMLSSDITNTPNSCTVVYMSETTTTEPQALHCDMLIDCESPVAMIDPKGYVYCASHGVQRRQAMSCRKLRSYELAKLTRGEQIAKY